MVIVFFIAITIVKKSEMKIMFKKMGLKYLNLKFCLLSISLLLFAVLPIGATQIASGEDVQVIKTEHFDFIFEIKSSNTAQVLANVAEGYYSEITNKLKQPDMDLHLPVVISNDTDYLNGYFTSNLYNRIESWSPNFLFSIQKK
ncbi:MAG: hypothetical protein BKP49_04330 [Treponema sp. CETP13]|nr:MAG: hypothetical protein BKP49_04330 [Treponema sp. CETP13]